MKATLLESTPPKQEERGRGGGGGGGGLEVEKAKKPTSGFQNHLELRLGISMNGFQDMVTSSDEKFKAGGPNFSTTADGPCGVGGGLPLNQRNNGIGGVKRWFYETGSGFVHPWSLAARQEKAVLEQKANPSSTVSRATHPPPPPVVGWPPVRASRRNLVSLPSSKPEIDAEKDAKKTKPTEGEDLSNKLEARPMMFVKVKMEGYAVGRKIDLKAHDSYESLSRTLQKMFHNFLSAKCAKTSEQDEQDEVVNPDYILLYEDNEGDRMLVGDVPWEMFTTSVKRLYIANGSRAPTSVGKRVAEEQQIEK